MIHFYFSTLKINLRLVAGTGNGPVVYFRPMTYQAHFF